VVGDEREERDGKRKGGCGRKRTGGIQEELQGFGVGKKVRRR